MMSDLLRNRLKAGMTGEQVLSLLGPTECGPGVRTGEAYVLKYYTGMERFKSPDDVEWLTLTFSADDAYVDYHIGEY